MLVKFDYLNICCKGINSFYILNPIFQIEPIVQRSLVSNIGVHIAAPKFASLL